MNLIKDVLSAVLLVATQRLVFRRFGPFRGFIARGVVGGVFLPVLQHLDLVEKYRK